MRSRTRCEHFVDAYLRLRRQQRVQQPRLVALEAQVVLFLGAQAGQRREARQPLLRQQAVGAVPEPHHGVAAPQRRQQLRQSRRLPAVIHLAVEFEPVDAAAHIDLGGSRPAERLTFGFHVPARVDQLAHHLRHRFETQSPGGRLAGRAQSEFLQLLAGRVLGFGVADQVDALLGQPEPAAGRGGFGPAPPIVQQEPRLKIILAPVFPMLCHAQAQARLHAPFLELQCLVHVQRRHHVQVQQLGHYLIAFPVRKRNLLQGDQPRDPGERPAIVQPRDLAASHQESAFHHHRGLAQLHALFAAAQRTGDFPLIAIVLPDIQPQFPRLALIPGEGLQFRDGHPAGIQPAGGGHHGYQPQRQGVRHRLARRHSAAGGIRVDIVFLAAKYRGDGLGVHWVRQ